jgi:hypothetical protein
MGRLFDGIVTTHMTPGGFFAAIEKTADEYAYEYPGKKGFPRGGLEEEAEIRQIAYRFALPIGGNTCSDPIAIAIDIAIHYRKDAVKVVRAFQQAWDFYQMACKAEGRMAA